MVVLRGSQTVGLGPHLSHWYTFTSRKSLNICTWSSAPYTVTEKLLYIIKGPMKVISGLLHETWDYFCMKNFISTTRNCHSHIHESTHFIVFVLLKVHLRFFPRLACGPPKFIGPVTYWTSNDKTVILMWFTKNLIRIIYPSCVILRIIKGVK